VFELTCALSGYPPVSEFIELQKQLGQAIDTGAADLFARPIPGERKLARTDPCAPAQPTHQAVKVVTLNTPKFKGDILVTNNENCGTSPRG